MLIIPFTKVAQNMVHDNGQAGANPPHSVRAAAEGLSVEDILARDGSPMPLCGQSVMYKPRGARRHRQFTIVAVAEPTQ